MNVGEAVTEAEKRGLRLYSLRQDEDGMWVAGLTLNGGHNHLDRDISAAAAIMKTAGQFPRIPEIHG